MIILENILKTYLTVLNEEGFSEINYKIDEKEDIVINFIFYNAETDFSCIIVRPYSEELDDVVFESLTAINTINGIKLEPEKSLSFDISSCISLSSKDMIIVINNFLANIKEHIVTKEIS